MLLLLIDFIFRAVFHEKVIYVKWPPNAEGTETPNNEADKYSLLINAFNREA